MGDPTRDDKAEPTLELPSLFRRRRRGTADREPEPEPAPEPEHTPSPDPDPAPSPAPEARPEAHVEAPAGRPFADPTPGGRAPRERRVPRARRTGPLLPASIAALLTGLLVGLAGAVLTYGGLQGCELVRGTDSCGDGPGLLLLLGILVAMVLAGAGLLAWLGVSDPRSTSFLGVGLTAVVAMLALLGTLLSAWMFVVVPALSAAAYLLAWWVTSRFVEQLDDGPGVDVR